MPSLIFRKKKSRDEYAKELSEPLLGPSYREKLSKGLLWLERWFAAPRSLKALDRSVALAYFYTASIFFGVWLFGGDGKLGSLELMKIGVPWWQRLLVVGFLIILGIFTYKFDFVSLKLNYLFHKVLPKKQTALWDRVLATLLTTVF